MKGANGNMLSFYNLSHILTPVYILLEVIVHNDSEEPQRVRESVGLACTRQPCRTVQILEEAKAGLRKAARHSRLAQAVVTRHSVAHCMLQLLSQQQTASRPSAKL